MYLRFNRLLCEYEPVAVKHIMYELNKNIKNMRESDISYAYYLSINTIDDLSDKRINWRDVERIKRVISYICDLYAKYSPNEVNEIMIKAYDKATGVNNDFYDKENKCSVIQMATAGYSKDELSVSVDGKKLTVKGTPKEEDNKESVSYVRNKIHKSVFERVYSYF